MWLQPGGPMRTWWLPCLMLMPAVAAGQRAEPVETQLGAVPVAPVAVPTQVIAPPQPLPEVDPRIHRHLGFFLRLDVGPGYFGTSSPSRSAKGVGFGVGLAIGGAVTEDLIIAAESWAIGAVNPTQTSNGVTQTWSDSAALISGFGLNITHYFMPANVYLSLTPGISALALEGKVGLPEFQVLTSSLGFGLRFAVGKEWWVSDHWGLGMALEFDFSTNRVTSLGFTETWTSFGGGIVFSATYN